MNPVTLRLGDEKKTKSDMKATEERGCVTDWHR